MAHHCNDSLKLTCEQVRLMRTLRGQSDFLCISDQPRPAGSTNAGDRFLAPDPPTIYNLTPTCPIESSRLRARTGSAGVEFSTSRVHTGNA